MYPGVLLCTMYNVHTIYFQGRTLSYCIPIQLTYMYLTRCRPEEFGRQTGDKVRTTHIRCKAQVVEFGEGVHKSDAEGVQSRSKQKKKKEKKKALYTLYAPYDFDETRGRGAHYTYG